MLGPEPRIEPDGVVHRVVMADGTYVNGWCLLTAVDGKDGEVLAWQWCSGESTAAYKALFEQMAPPDVLVCDGMKGIPTGARNMAAHADPTMSGARATRHQGRPDLKPRLQAGRGAQETRRRAHPHPRSRSRRRMGEALNAWHERWSRMLAERTYAKDNPDDPRAATSRGGWWWTHLPLRRAYLRLERLFKDGTLFCFLDPALTAPGSVPRDSNRLEGGPDAAPQAHARQPPRPARGTHAPRLRMALHMHSAKPDPALILKQHGQDAKTGTNTTTTMTNP